MFRVASFNEYKEKYKHQITNDRLYELAYYYEVYKNFTLHWNLDELDISKMFAKSFKSMISVRLWRSDDFHPKEVMAYFIAQDKNFVRHMFRDLFNDAKDLNMRVQRFIYHCDMLLADQKAVKKRYIDHYHSDLKMISLYLTFFNPDKFAPYSSGILIPYLKSLDALKIPAFETFDKYQQIMKTTGILLKKDDELKRVLDNAEGTNGCLENAPCLVAFDFASFCISNN